MADITSKENGHQVVSTVKRFYDTLLRRRHPCPKGREKRLRTAEVSEIAASMHTSSQSKTSEASKSREG